MAYPNYQNFYPATYQSPYMNQYNNMYPTYQQAAPMQTPQMQSSNMLCSWVQGEAGAKAFYVPPGQTAILMDSEGETFYIKTTDQSGMPSPLRYFDYREIVNTTPQDNSNTGASTFNPSDYVTRNEYDELKKELDSLRSHYENKSQGVKYGGKNNGQQTVQ